MAKNSPAAKREMRAAREELDGIADRDRRTGNHEETPEYLAANDRVIAAEKNVSWYRR